MATISVAMGQIQTRCATTAVCHEGITPSALNHIRQASPSTACGKNTGSRMNFWNTPRKRHW